MLILELISIIALTFSLLTVLFEVDQLHGILLFLYIVLILGFFLWKNLEEKYSFPLLGMLLFLPWILIRTQEYAFFTILYTAVFTLYYHRKLGRLYPEDLSLRFRVTYGILLVITLIGTMTDFMGALVVRALPYMLLYFFSTIILTTSLRHRQAGLDAKKTRRNIMLYLSVTSLLSLVATIEQLREGALYILSVIFEVFLGILYYGVYPLVYVIFWFYNKVIALVRRIPPGEEPQEEQALESFTDAFQESVGEIRSTPILETLIPIMFLLVILYFIVRFMKGRTGKKSAELPFEEVREFILEERDKGRRKRREKMPEHPKEQIRFYYRKYLREIGKHEKINRSDTASIVEEKGKAYFTKSPEIRALYSSLRYTEKQADGKMVEQFRGYLEKEQK